jgi:hypothetical protein
LDIAGVLIEGDDDVNQPDLARLAAQHETAVGSRRRADEPFNSQLSQNEFEKLGRDSLDGCDALAVDSAAPRRASQVEHRSDAILSRLGENHTR